MPQIQTIDDGTGMPREYDSDQGHGSGVEKKSSQFVDVIYGCPKGC